MKNKDAIIGLIIVLACSGLMISSLYYAKKVLSKEQSPTHVNIIVKKNDPKFKPIFWGMNRTKTKKEAMIERMTYN